MSQINTNTIKGVEDNDDVVFKTNNTTRITIASGGNVTLPTTTCTSLSAPSVGAINTAKAWVCFCGTQAVRLSASYNVSGVTDNGTGNYTVSFTVSMPNNAYCVSGTTDSSNTGGNRGTNAIMYPKDDKLAGSVKILCAYGSDHNASQGALHDPGDISVIITGD